MTSAFGHVCVIVMSLPAVTNVADSRCDDGCDVSCATFTASPEQRSFHARKPRECRRSSHQNRRAVTTHWSCGP